MRRNQPYVNTAGPEGAELAEIRAGDISTLTTKHLESNPAKWVRVDR